MCQVWSCVAGRSPAITGRVPCTLTSSTKQRPRSTSASVMPDIPGQTAIREVGWYKCSTKHNCSCWFTLSLINEYLIQWPVPTTTTMSPNSNVMHDPCVLFDLYIFEIHQESVKQWPCFNIKLYKKVCFDLLSMNQAITYQLYSIR